MPGTYDHTTFQQLVDQLAVELSDTGKVHFEDTELQLNLKESMRVFNLLTGWHRETASFDTTADTAYYDIGTQLSTQLGRTVTDRELVGMMQYRLMEPYEPVASAGISEMFTHADLVRALQQRRDRFLADTKQIATKKSAIDVGVSSEGLVKLDDTTITIVRALWEGADGKFRHLRSSDESVATALQYQWRQTPGLPQQYSVAAQPNLTIQIIPPPIQGGKLHLFTVETGAALDTSIPTVAGVMDDCSWGLAWGAMADLLSRDGYSFDPVRAQFCEQMYALAVELARSMPVILNVRINNVSVQPCAINMLDSMRVGWDGKQPDTPQLPALMGSNLLALCPVPDSSYDISLIVVRNTPMPSLTTKLQYGREQLAALVQWAKQISLFKHGGIQLEMAQGAAKALIEQARIYNEERIMQSQYLCEMFGITSGSQWQPPRQATVQIESDDPRDVANTRQRREGSTGYKRPARRLGGR